MDQAHELADRQCLIEALRDRSRYPHLVESVDVVETHISWLLLTGQYAYKVKKPVDLGFVDFSTLERRHFFCKEELRLNHRFASELYLEVVEIKGSVTDPHMGGVGHAIEYAVKMRQFSHDARLDRVLSRGALRMEDCDRMAEAIAAGHAVAEIAMAASPLGAPDTTHRTVLNTLDIAQTRLPLSAHARIESIRDWCKQQFAELADCMQARRTQGHVRECHGDLHLENMVLIEGRIVMFDCLEFNPDLRWIDTMSDVAFVTMDLTDRGRPEMAHRLLNRYVEVTGDYAGLWLLPYYQVYRAMVRAAVAGMTLRPGLNEFERRDLLAKADEYLQLAADYTTQAKPVLVITHGCSGAGKTTVTQALLEALGAIRLRSDVERQRLEQRRAEHAESIDRYSAASRRAVYVSMAKAAEVGLLAGYSIIVDATFLDQSDRQLMRVLAERLRVPLVILAFRSSADELRARVARRAREGTDASEATWAVLEEQLRSMQPLSQEELTITVNVAAGSDAAIGRLVERINERCR